MKHVHTFVFFFVGSSPATYIVVTIDTVNIVQEAAYGVTVYMLIGFLRIGGSSTA